MESQKPLHGFEAKSPKISPSSSELPGPLFEPGPGWGKKLNNWLKKNLKKNILPIAIILVLAASLTIFLTTPKVSDKKTANINLSGQQRIELGQVKENIRVEEVIKLSGLKETVIIVKAEKGEGITHLARKSLAVYLENNHYPELTPEHKIYIEDYLKDLHGERFLQLGEELEFSVTDIENAIEKAEQLTEEQLNNLTQYAQLVPGL